MIMWIFGFGLIALGYAVFIEPRWFTVRRFQIRSPKKIPRPFKILHLSDIHFSSDSTSKEVFLMTLNSLEPDFIFVTGDIIDHDDGIEPAARILGSLKSKLGSFAILGNHDYFDYHFLDNFKYHLRGIKISNRQNDVKRLREKLEAAGIQVLVNGKKEVQA